MATAAEKYRDKLERCVRGSDRHRAVVVAIALVEKADIKPDSDLAVLAREFLELV
jgi:hypothetical protein